LALCDKAEFAGYVWCAKEALYKLYGRRGIDLSNDLQIRSFDPKSETMRGLLLGEPEAHIEILHYDNNIVAVATFTKE
jgi:phosphopantetheinyl transferase